MRVPRIPSLRRPPGRRRLVRRIIKRRPTPEMAEHQGFIELRRGEFLVGAKWIPHFVVKDAFTCDDGTLPWRILSFRRSMPYPTYDEIVDSDDPLLVSESGWTAFGLPVFLAALALVALIYGAIKGWSLGSEVFLLLWFLIWTPGWMCARYLKWWIRVVDISHAKVGYSDGFIRARARSWTAEQVDEVIAVIRGGPERKVDRKKQRIRWAIFGLLSFYWRFMQIGTVSLIDANGQPFVEMRNIIQPALLKRNVLDPMTGAAEEALDAIRRDTAESLALQRQTHGLAVIATVRTLAADGAPPENIAELTGLSVERVNVIIGLAPPPSAAPSWKPPWRK
jgi:hypothetical protein